MSTKIVRCDRCRKRYRGHGNWNIEFIAGLVVGHLCPDCQTIEEDLEAELKLITDPPLRQTALLPPRKGAPKDQVVAYVTDLAHSLINSYPTPEIMRDKATKLESARTDAAEMVRLMRGIADEMESGTLYEVSP
jgi:hypothetical protein